MVKVAFELMSVVYQSCNACDDGRRRQLLVKAGGRTPSSRMGKSHLTDGFAGAGQVEKGY